MLSPIMVGACVLISLLGTASTAAAASLELLGPDGARLYVDGALMGTLPMAEPIQLQRGRHDLKVEAAGYHDWSEGVQLPLDNSEHVQIVYMRPLKRSTNTFRSLFLLGLAQHYQGRHTQGWLYLSGELAGLGAAAAGQMIVSSGQDDYDAAVDRYNSSIDPDAIQAARTDANQALSRQDRGKQLRTAGLAFFGTMAAWSLLDAWFRFPSVDGGSGTAPRFAKTPGEGLERPLIASSLDPSGLHLGVRFGF